MICEDLDKLREHKTVSEGKTVQNRIDLAAEDQYRKWMFTAGVLHNGKDDADGNN